MWVSGPSGPLGIISKCLFYGWTQLGLHSVPTHQPALLRTVHFTLVTRDIGPLLLQLQTRPQLSLPPTCGCLQASEVVGGPDPTC